jgi:aminoglycoside 3-N-acetyltransferase
MQSINIFKTDKGTLSNIMLFNSLLELGAKECDVLYVHSGLNFGIPNSELSKGELLNTIIGVLKELEVKTIIFPTFTFSFCNGKDYSINDSKTSMGVLNEYFRKLPNVKRSRDPLMSNALLGENEFLIDNIGKFSCGKDSTYDLLRNSNLKVKFLFLGPKIGDCFTYMHYLENLFEVPYRYEKEFSGNVLENNELKEVTYSLFVRYGNVFAGAGSYVYENILLERGIAKRLEFGNANITILSESEATQVYKDMLEVSPNFFLKDIYDVSKKTPHILLENMISL